MWVLLAFVVVGLLAIGVTRDTGPRTPDERDRRAREAARLPGLRRRELYESRNTGSVQIRELIQQEVNRGELTDQQIIDRIVTTYNGEELLVPTASGIEALAWALPATAFVVGVAGLTFAFRRWQATSRRLGAATEADYALVESRARARVGRR